MMYWEDMRTKWGFGDGDKVPPGIAEYRSAYIVAVNLMAEKLESQVRAAAFDRAGYHNWCLIVFVPAGLRPKKKLTDGAWKFDGAEADPDQSFTEAVMAAGGLNVDTYVLSRVGFQRKLLLKALKNLPVGAPAGL